ncbi:diaminopimelate decarboxylase [Pantoea sp. Mhis]|uniref:diaminopimelate decarboxylase n=1 Tax=Pantoea sp. Mhis TaxID=2576759 RepID=UPI00135A5770|nr:diaminopimelate decarboxylase [Pantoea sp. Mhis]MXP56674.1 diaminopimelate decarboxylase [Pantoea sp. Mhis]
MPRSLKNTETALNASNLLLLTKYYSGPFWAYDSAIIHDCIKQLSIFDIVRFAQKACSNIHILKLMRIAGVKVDSVSLGEIERALIAGYKTNSEDIVFTSDLIEHSTLIRIAELKVPVNAGSIDMLRQLGSISPGHSVWLRINPGFGYGHSQKTNTGGENSKHGIWNNEIPEALKIIKKYNLRLIGLHMHIGSGVDYEHLQYVCNAMIQHVIQLNHDISIISAGGGLSVPYRFGEKKIDTRHYFNLWNDAREHIAIYLGHAIQLEIEPGRFLVAEAGVLVSQIRAIKQVGQRYFLLVNVGFNDLLRPCMYGSYHHISILPADGRILNEYKMINYIVAGPLCESGDVFTQQEGGILESRILPIAQVGDYLVFHDTGAYGASMSSNYNTRPLIPEILFEKEGIREIRRSQTIQELLELELNSGSLLCK